MEVNDGMETVNGLLETYGQGPTTQDDPDTEEPTDEPDPETDDTPEEEPPEAPEEEEVTPDEEEEYVEEETEPEGEPEEEGPSQQELMETIQSLRDEMADLREQRNGEETEAEGEEPEAEEFETPQFVSEEEYIEALDSADKFNEMLARVYQRAREDTIREIPDLVAQTHERQTNLRSLVTNFYNENPELKDHKEYVAAISNKVSSEHPSWEQGRVLKETAKVVKSRLNVAEQVNDKKTTKKKKKKKPAYASGTKSTRQKKEDTRTNEERLMDELLGLD